MRTKNRTEFLYNVTRSKLVLFDSGKVMFAKPYMYIEEHY